MPPMTSIYGNSPHSSSGIFGSTEGTPDTRLTAFSPDDARPLKASNDVSGGAKSGSTQQDPFVTTTTKGKEQKLSATASAFQPFTIPVTTPTPAIELGFTATAALPGSVQKLNNLIDQCKLAQGSKYGNATIPAVIQSVQQGDTNQHGTFSTDTGATRCIQVTSVYQVDASVPQVVVNSLEMLKTRYKLKGSERVEPGISAAYLRYSHIQDAAKVFTALKSDLPQHAVEYISPAAFASAVHSPSKGSYSAHEGQVVLTASYPIGTPCNKKTFEDGLRALVSVEGNLNAWQKLAATEAGTFRMVAEFCDSALALHAVQRLNGKSIKFSQGDVVIFLELHTPDMSQSSHRLGPMTTPTRRSGEQSDIGDALGRLSLNRNQSQCFSSRADSLPAPVTGSSVLPYMASNTGAFGASFGLQTPVTGLPVMIGGVCGPAPIAFSHIYPSGVHQPYIENGDFNRTTPGAADFGHNNPTAVGNGFDLGHGSPAVALGGFNQHGYQQFGFQQQGFQHQNYGYGSAYSNAQLFGHHRDSNYFTRPSGRRQNAVRAPQHSMRSRQFPNPAAGHHNHVDVHRIRQGIDVRTTVMLRNIPNKVDQAMLKEIVDESSFGRYDFMYLRIDFSNDCNVGYAFINFADPLDIIDFVVARSNQKWHRFKSDKVAEVSYATIQGRDCLIQKFRNSSVMLEPPHYRPKLFFTIHDPTGRVGEEDQFPASDNASKLKRSCENAEHVGLFAPSAGQHLRDEQRRRRSQFDRGTSLAEREEYGYDEGSMYSGYRPSYCESISHPSPEYELTSVQTERYFPW